MTGVFDPHCDCPKCRSRAALSAQPVAPPAPTGDEIAGLTPVAWRVGDNGYLHKTREEADKHVSGWRRQGLSCSDPQPLYDVNSLASLREETVKVLEPFAKIASEYSPREDDDFNIICDKDVLGEKLLLRKFRAARALLTKLKGDTK